MSLKIHLKRREKSVKKTVLKKGARLFYFIHPRKSKKVLCVSKSPLLREGMPKREIEISKTGLRLNCLPDCKSRAFWRNVVSFLRLLFGSESERGVRLLLDNFIRIKNTPIFPLEKGPTSSPPPPNRHTEARERTT